MLEGMKWYVSHTDANVSVWSTPARKEKKNENKRRILAMTSVVITLTRVVSLVNWVRPQTICQ